MLPIIMGVVTAFLLVLMVSAFVVVKAVFFSDSADNTITIEVENFTGKFYDEELIELLEKTNYRVTVKYEYSETVESGVILRQSPSAGQTRKGAKNQKFADVGFL